jgi:hypothetical protein
VEKGEWKKHRGRCSFSSLEIFGYGRMEESGDFRDTSDRENYKE